MIKCLSSIQAAQYIGEARFESKCHADVIKQSDELMKSDGKKEKSGPTLGYTRIG